MSGFYFSSIRRLNQGPVLSLFACYSSESKIREYKQFEILFF